MLLVIAWLMYVVCFAVSMINPMISNEWVMKMVIDKNYKPMVVLWAVSVVSMIVMMREYGFWTMCIVHVVLGVVAGVRGYVVVNSMME